MKISIITATYNANLTLLDCLNSVSRQSVQPEHLIIDGGSRDGTIELVEKYNGHCVTISSEPDNGIYDAMNKGIARTGGDIVGILNADDFYADSKVLEDVLSVFEDKDVDACYGDLCYVDYHETEKVIRYWKSGEYAHGKFYWGWMPPHPTFFVRKSVYQQLGGFNLEMGSAADYELMLRFLVKNRLKARYLPRVLVKMRVGGISNATFKNRMLANRMDRRAWRINNLNPYPWTLALKPLRKIGQWVSRPGVPA